MYRSENILAIFSSYNYFVECAKDIYEDLREYSLRIYGISHWRNVRAKTAIFIDSFSFSRLTSNISEPI